MKKILAVVLGLACAAPAWASTTWSGTGSRSVKAVSTTGSEAAPSSSTVGMSLNNVGGFSVIIEADSGQTLSGAGTLLAYVYDATPGRWTRAPELDLTVTASAVRGQSFAGFNVSSPRGRVAFVPSSVTVSGGGVTVYLNATDQTGRAI